MNSSVQPVELRRSTPHPQLEYWSVCKVEALFETPFLDLVYRAAQVHREHFDPRAIQLSTLLSIKTGACPEDCKYCPQSGHYNTGLDKQKLMEVQKVLEEAARAKAIGSTRFCMGAAWRGPKEKELEVVTNMIREVKSLGMEACVTLGMLQDGQAEKLKEAGLIGLHHGKITITPEQQQALRKTLPIIDD